MSIAIAPIEDALAEQGIETVYTGTGDYTSFLIRNGSREIEILDAVSGDSFNSENLTEAILYGSKTVDATGVFENVETVEEFLKAVAELLS